MKIVQIVTQLEAGGAQKVAWLLNDGLRAKGHEADLWFLYPKTSARLGRSDPRCLYPARPNARALPGIVHRLRDEFLGTPIDALITHTHYANILGQSAAALARVPIRVAVHHNLASDSPFAARSADSLLGASPVYTHIVCVSSVTRRSFRDYLPAYRRKLRTIANGIKWRPPGGHEYVRARWNIPEHLRLVVNVGRLAPQKNQATLLVAASLLHDVFLVIVGEGDLRASLEASAASLGIQDRVLFTGELSTPEVSQLLRMADVFALPSLWEAMPMAALEAMSAGRPVVASDIPALRETLGNAMEPCDSRDPNDLARAIRILLTDRFRAAGRVQNGLRRSHEFSLDRMVERYTSLLENAARSHHYREHDEHEHEAESSLQLP